MRCPLWPQRPGGERLRRPVPRCVFPGVVGADGDSGTLDDSPTGGDSPTSGADSADSSSPPLDADSSSPPLDSGSPADAIDSVDSAPDVASCTPPTPPSLDDCVSLFTEPNPPVIDGILDCNVPLWSMPEQGWTASGTVPAGVETHVAAAWRPDGLYLFVSVTGAGATRYPAPLGASPFCGDAIELFVDSQGEYASAPHYNNPGTTQFIVEAPSVSMTTSQVGEMYVDTQDQGPWKGQFVAVRTPDGFDVEAFVVAANLRLATWSLATGGRVGLDVSVDLGDPARALRAARGSASSRSRPPIWTPPAPNPRATSQSSVIRCSIAPPSGPNVRHTGRMMRGLASSAPCVSAYVRCLGSVLYDLYTDAAPPSVPLRCAWTRARAAETRGSPLAQTRSLSSGRSGRWRGGRTRRRGPIKMIDEHRRVVVAVGGVPDGK